MNADQRRRELGSMLRWRREQLRPESVALGSGVRRRTPGLRRDEVASLSSVSSAWYTWLEQGRNIHPSMEALRRIARTLLLSEQEWLYASLLAGFGLSESPTDKSGQLQRSTTSIQNTLDAFTNSPAVLYDCRFDVLAANAAARAVYGTDMCSDTKWERNMLWRFFMDDNRRRMYPDGEFDLGIQNLIEALRMNWAGSDGGVEELVDELRHTSGGFDSIWNQRKVGKLGIVPGQVRLRDCRQVISIQYSRLYVSDLPGHAIAALVPVTSEHTAILQRYLDRVG